MQGAGEGVGGKPHLHPTAHAFSRDEQNLEVAVDLLPVEVEEVEHQPTSFSQVPAGLRCREGPLPYSSEGTGA